eukprot:scaffold102754_cov63-Phaeocystis_antarctica.AAC.5
MALWLLLSILRLIVGQHSRRVRSHRCLPPSAPRLVQLCRPLRESCQYECCTLWIARCRAPPRTDRRSSRAGWSARSGRRGRAPTCCQRQRRRTPQNRLGLAALIGAKACQLEDELRPWEITCSFAVGGGGSGTSTQSPRQRCRIMWET